MKNIKIFSFGFILSFISVLILFNFVNMKNNKVEKMEVKNYIKDKVHSSSYSYSEIKKLKEFYDNNDIFGYIYIPKIVEYPFVKTNNNEYYINHNLYHEIDNVGVPFIDYRTLVTDKQLLIYGYNLCKYKAPFSDLENYYNEDFYKENKYIYLKVQDTINKYEIFSAYIETYNYDYYKEKNKSNNEWFNYINYLKNKSWYNTDIDLNNSDQILIIKTVSNLEEYKNYENKYLMLIARKI